MYSTIVQEYTHVGIVNQQTDSSTRVKILKPQSEH